MALTANQIISLATQIAKVPGYVTQAQQLLNAILQELAQDYDFEVIRKYVNVDPAAVQINVEREDGQEVLEFSVALPEKAR